MNISLESDDVFARALPNLPGGPFISPARDRSDRRGARQAHVLLLRPCAIQNIY